MESWEEDEYIEESDEDMDRNEEDEELDGIMEFVSCNKISFLTYL